MTQFTPQKPRVRCPVCGRRQASRDEAGLIVRMHSAPDGFTCPGSGSAALRDSDGSPKGGDARGSVHDSAVPKGQSPNPTPSVQEQAEK